jgi:hypothetical protein
VHNCYSDFPSNYIMMWRSVELLDWSGAFGVVLLRLIHSLGKVLVNITVSLSLCCSHTHSHEFNQSLTQSVSHLM